MIAPAPSLALSLSVGLFVSSATWSFYMCSQPSDQVSLPKRVSLSGHQRRDALRRHAHEAPLGRKGRRNARELVAALGHVDAGLREVNRVVGSSATHVGVQGREEVDRGLLARRAAVAGAGVDAEDAVVLRDNQPTISSVAQRTDASSKRFVPAATPATAPVSPRVAAWLATEKHWSMMVVSASEVVVWTQDGESAGQGQKVVTSWPGAPHLTFHSSAPETDEATRAATRAREATSMVEDMLNEERERDEAARAEEGGEAGSRDTGEAENRLADL